MSRNPSYKMRACVLALAFALPVLAHGEDGKEGHERERFELVETTIENIQQAYRSELLTPEQLSRCIKRASPRSIRRGRT